VHTFRCDIGKAATVAADLDGPWAGQLSQAAVLPTHLCRDVVVITTHLYEAIGAAGGLIANLAAQGADVEVLSVADGDGAVRGAWDATPARELTRLRGGVLAAYRRLGVPEVRRHRLGLESGKIGDAQTDLIAAISELVGHDCYPGLWCLAPWRHDGHPDHDAVGRAAEEVCHIYNLRLVRYLCAAWEWVQPQDLPWNHVRQFALADKELDRKRAAMSRLRADAGQDPMADRELFLL